MINQNQKPATPRPTAKRNDVKMRLAALKLTTTVGAVSLTLAGWGLLSFTEATTLAASQPSEAFVSAAPGNVAAAFAEPARPNVFAAPTRSVAAQESSALVKGRPVAAKSTSTPEATSTPTTVAEAVATPTATAAPTAEPTVLFKLDVVQWVQTQAGDPVAVVRDNRGTLWYVWGTDVPLIEQGLAPTIQPQPVNGRGRTRGS